MKAPADIREAAEHKSENQPSIDKFNAQAAELLAADAHKLPIGKATPIYEQLLSVFPTSAKIWKQYVEAHMALGNDDATKQIFSRCLLNCLHIPLWRCYIKFIRKVNDKKGFEGQEETRKAFEFMLNYVGSDITSGPIWIEYIAFLTSLPAMNPQEESHRMTAIRRTYQRAVVTPTHHVEQLWKDYEGFENSVSRQLAKGLIQEYQPKYTSARAVYRERKKFVDEIDWNLLATPPSSTLKEELQWTAWKKLLMFEKGNPQRIDAASSIKRVIFSYEQSLMYLYHYPDMWYDYATWHARNGSPDAAAKVFQRALQALPESDVLKYAFAEFEESRGSIQSAKRIYETLLSDGNNSNALNHIQYIRFIRRTEGVEAARKYFLDSRKLPSCTYHVYVAYALMAFCLDKDPKVAHNIFEAGLNHFKNEPSYILEYADFLSRINDDRNIRALFERALSTLPPEDSVEVWKRFVQFEQTYGDLSSMLKVEQRRKEALAKINQGDTSAVEDSLNDVISRHNFMNLWPCSPNELDHLSRKECIFKEMKANKSAGNTSVTPGKLVASDNSCMAPNNSKSPDFDKVHSVIPTSLLTFFSNLPSVDGPTPNADIVLSICLQGDTKARGSAKRNVQEEDETSSVQSQPLPRDAFRLRQIQKSRVRSVSQTASASVGSALSGDLSGTTV